MLLPRCVAAACTAAAAAAGRGTNACIAVSTLQPRGARRHVAAAAAGGGGGSLQQHHHQHRRQQQQQQLQRRRHRHRSAAAAAAAAGGGTGEGADGPAGSSAADRISYGTILLALIDSNPYLSDGSRAAITAAGDLARQHGSAVTVLVVDEPGKAGELAVRAGVITQALQEAGAAPARVTLLEKQLEGESGGSALLGDVADDIGADLLVLSSEVVHAKHVDANLLAEFCSAPILMLP